MSDDSPQWPPTAPPAPSPYGGRPAPAGRAAVRGLARPAGLLAARYRPGRGAPAGLATVARHARCPRRSCAPRSASVRAEVAKAVVGQDAAVSGLVIALLCRGHVLLEGVPGVAKTLLVRTLSAALDLDTKRVQFTPDLMPGDVTGSLVYDARTAEFSFREGPVFTNLLLADEINRTPPKTQASLLEAMEERQVSVDGTPRPLPDPFLVIATQNPVEYEGTYTLPEAQLDRFLLKLVLGLPERDEEIEVLRRHSAGFDPRDLRAAGRAAGRVGGDARRGARRGGPGPDLARGARLHGRRLPGHAPVAVAVARASRRAAPPRCSRRRARGPGCRAAAS